MASACYISFLVVAAVLVDGIAAVDYTVGDSTGWTVPPNNSSDFYNNWASNKEFRPGDSLVFNWTGNHTVSPVSKEDYDNCTKNTGNILASSPVGVPITANDTLYFVCTIDSHCEQGQKMRVVIGNGSPTPESVAPPLNVGASFSVFVSTVVIFFLQLLY